MLPHGTRSAANPRATIESTFAEMPAIATTRRRDPERVAAHGEVGERQHHRHEVEPERHVERDARDPRPGLGIAPSRARAGPAPAPRSRARSARTRPRTSPSVAARSLRSSRAPPRAASARTQTFRRETKSADQSHEDEDTGGQDHRDADVRLTRNTLYCRSSGNDRSSCHAGHVERRGPPREVAAAHPPEPGLVDGARRRIDDLADVDRVPDVRVELDQHRRGPPVSWRFANARKSGQSSARSSRPARGGELDRAAPRHRGPGRPRHAPRHLDRRGPHRSPSRSASTTGAHPKPSWKTGGRRPRPDGSRGILVVRAADRPGRGTDPRDEVDRLSVPPVAVLEVQQLDPHAREARRRSSGPSGSGRRSSGARRRTSRPRSRPPGP